MFNTRSSRSEMFLKIWQNLQENTCARVSFLIKLRASGLRSATLLKRDSSRVSFCKLCEIFKNTFFTEHLRTITSGIGNLYLNEITLKKYCFFHGVVTLLRRGVQWTAALLKECCSIFSLLKQFILFPYLVSSLSSPSLSFDLIFVNDLLSCKMNVRFLFSVVEN